MADQRIADGHRIRSSREYVPQSSHLNVSPDHLGESICIYLSVLNRPLSQSLGTSLMSSSSSIAGGLALIVVAGFLNGSWNVSFNSLALVDGVIDFGGAWLLFQLYAALINIPICLYWAGGPERVAWIVLNETPVATILWICLFSIVWGCGSVGFGLACKLAGVGMGTNLTIGVVTALGALLPLILEKAAFTPSGFTILGGLVVCCIGLFFSMRSLQERDRPRTDESEEEVENIDTAGKVETNEETDGDETPEPTNQTPPSSISTSTKVAICLVAGILATQLQFAFVFGQSIVDLASSRNGPGTTTPTGYAAVIWLFAFTTSSPVSILYGLYSTAFPYRNLLSCGIFRHLVIILTTTLPWVGHVHLYGIANTILPEELAAAVSWPVLMMTTVLVAMIWSWVLGEWKEANKSSRRLMFTGLGIVVLGIIVLMTSLVVK